MTPCHESGPWGLSMIDILVVIVTLITVLVVGKEAYSEGWKRGYYRRMEEDAEYDLARRKSLIDLGDRICRKLGEPLFNESPRGKPIKVQPYEFD